MPDLQVVGIPGPLSDTASSRKSEQPGQTASVDGSDGWPEVDHRGRGLYCGAGRQIQA